MAKENKKPGYRKISQSRKKLIIDCLTDNKTFYNVEQQNIKHYFLKAITLVYQI